MKKAKEDDSHQHFVKATYPQNEPWKTNIYFGERNGTGEHGHLALSGAMSWYFGDIEGKEIIKEGDELKAEGKKGRIVLKRKKKNL